MTRAQTPTIHCDYDEWGSCGMWSVDYYECTAAAVDGVKITAKKRAPGWVTTSDDRDLCPEHSVDMIEGSEEGWVRRGPFRPTHGGSDDA